MTGWAKTVPQLIVELQSLDNPKLEVRLSVDGGQTSRPITFVENNMGRCLLRFSLYSWQEHISPETGLLQTDCPKYLVCGKKIPQLIQELNTFENMDRVVEISVDDKDNVYPISRIEQSGDCCLLMFCPD